MMNEVLPETPEVLYNKTLAKNQQKFTEFEPKDKFYLYVECWKKSKFDTIAILSVDEIEYPDANQLRAIRDKINEVIIDNRSIKHAK